MLAFKNTISSREHTSFISPKMTFSFETNLFAISPQNAPNCAVVAAVTSEAFPITLPVNGC